MMSETVPDEFKKIANDFISDVETTIPELMPSIHKWWKPISVFEYIDDEVERKTVYEKAKEQSVKFLFSFCKKKYPEHFFEILYQNEKIFNENSNVDTEFLPHVHFKDLWKLDISEKTKEVIWKYLQLILFCIVGAVDNKEAFGDSAKLFETLTGDEFKNQLENALGKIQEVLEKDSDEKSEQERESINLENIPGVNDIHSHITGMMDGKLGALAREIAEETAETLNLDTDNVSNVQDLFSKMMKNPAQLMGLAKNVGDKLDSKLKSGDINEKEIFNEVGDLMRKMENIPGMENIQQMINQMGLKGQMGKNVNLDLNKMQQNLDKQRKNEEMRKRIEKKKSKKSEEPSIESNNVLNEVNRLTDEEIMKLFENDGSIPNVQKKSKNKNKKGKSKK